MVNLKVKPYNLDEESIKWVEDTIKKYVYRRKNRTTICKHGSKP